MKINYNNFFSGKFEYLNLNDFYLKYKELISDTKDPSKIQKVLNCLEKSTYGGYGENRKDIWKGTYMDKKQNYIHLGIDINVPGGLAIRCPFDADVIDTFKDTDTQIGWGGRYILQRKRTLPYLILAHIEPTSLIKRQSFEKDDYIGCVGTWPTNGNTFQHLHVQAVYDLNINDFDGYGNVKDLLNNPNPFEIDFE